MNARTAIAVVIPCFRVRGHVAVLFGGYHWLEAVATGDPTPLEVVMIATVSAISGLQFLLAFVGYDIAAVPRTALHPMLERRAGGRGVPP